MVKAPVPQKNDDEIDLVELLLKMVNALRDNFWIIVTFFAIGAASGIAYFVTSKKQYSNKMIISSSILTTTYANILFENANTHLVENNYAILQSEFKLDTETLKEIASLKIENLTKEEGGELKESDRYLITANVYDQSILPNLQKGVIDYLENNEFVRIRINQQRSYLTQMLSAAEKELNDLQQFKQEIYSGKFFANAKGNVMFDPTTVNSKVLELTQRRIEYKNALELINSVQLIEGFSAFKHPSKPSLLRSLLAGSLLGLFVAGAFIAFKSIRRILRLADEQKAKDAA